MSSNLVGPDGMLALSDMLRFNETITSLSLKGTIVFLSASFFLLPFFLLPFFLSCFFSFIFIIFYLGNKLTDRDAVRLADALRENRRLAILDLSENALSETAGNAFGVLLEVDTPLQELFLGWNW